MATKRNKPRKPYDPVAHLRVGVHYRVIFKTQKGNYQWWEMEFVGLYIGKSAPEDNLYYFSMRPESGTSHLRGDQILEAYEMPHTIKPRHPVNRKRIEAP